MKNIGFRRWERESCINKEMDVMKHLTQTLQMSTWICILGVVMFTPAQANCADFTSNGTVDLADFSLFASSWKRSLLWSRERLQPQMIAHWQLDQDALDNHSTHDGVVYGDPDWVSGPQAKIGSGAILMNGQDYIEIDSTDFPVLEGSFTLVAWIRTSYALYTQTIFSKGDDLWQLGLEADTARLFLSCPGLAGNNYLAGSSSLADGKWHQVAGVVDKSQEKLLLYVDGLLDAEASASGQVNQNDSPLWLGGSPQPMGSWWYGTLDNLKIYNYALTTNQIFTQKTYHVDISTGSDQKTGMGRQEAFKTIQHAIDSASDGDIILVWPGIYTESLFFDGKAITIRSAADAAILRAEPIDGVAVTFMNGEQTNSILENFIIMDSEVALYIHQTSPVLRHLTIVNNQYGAGCIFNALPVFEHCIFWNNSVADIDHHPSYLPEVSYSCIERTFTGTGNINTDPLFVNPVDSNLNNLDFHLQSQYGRYLPDQSRAQRPKPENWVFDTQTSPCIDTGNEQVNPAHETMPNGGRINMGAYGNTLFASKSPWLIQADLDYNGDVCLKDLLIFTENWLVSH